MRRQTKITRTIYAHELALFRVAEDGTPVVDRATVYLAEDTPLERRESAARYPEYVGVQTLKVTPKRVVLSIEDAVKAGTIEDVEEVPGNA